MDKKTLIILLISFMLMMAWGTLVNKIFPPIPLPQTNTLSQATNFLSGTNLPAAAQTSSLPASIQSRTNQLPTPIPAARTNVAEQLLTLDHDETRYTFTSQGGGLKQIDLKNYPATLNCGPQRNKNQTNAPASLNNRAPLPLLAAPALQEDGFFELSRTTNGVRMEKVLSNGLILVKEFVPSTNFVLHATFRVENRSDQPLRVPAHELIIGTATPIGQHDESMMLGLQWYDGSDAEMISEGWFANKTLGCFPGTPRTEYLAGQSNVVWAAVNNQFFAIVAIPQHPALQVVGRRILLPEPTAAERAADPRVMAHPFGYQTALVLPEVVIPQNQGLEKKIDFYAGPKEYKTLARMGKEVDLVMNFGEFFGFFAKALLLSMNGLYSMGLSYGVAIIVITIIIKLLFWPLTNASTRSMKRLSALQPEMKALQEKYKDDPKKMNMKLMEFMKENKVSPVGGCLPMLLQIPVFFGFFTMLRSAIELRGAQFLWACDLSQPDTVFIIPGINFPVNPLPLVMGVTMLWQARLTPPSPGMDPVQQSIMRYMPVMFMVFLYNFSAGLTLYWTVQNLLTIAQMKLTKDKTGPSPGAPGALKPGGLAPIKKKK